MESLLFPTRAWSRRWFGNCHWLAKRIHWLALLQSQEKRAKLFCLSWPVLFSWVMDTLDPSSDDDINNDVNSLYIEIIEQECTICGRKLSRKQRLEPTWVMFTAKVRNNTSPSQFWMWLQIVFYPHFFIRKIQKQLYAIQRCIGILVYKWLCTVWREIHVRRFTSVHEVNGFWTSRHTDRLGLT